MKLENNLATDTTWDIYEEQFVPEQFVTTGSAYMIGNGYLGYRGTFSGDKADRFPACVLTDTYDNADGRWKELVTAPNGLFARFVVSGQELKLEEAPSGYRRTLDFRYGIWKAAARWPELGLALDEERFASLDALHLIVSRVRLRAEREVVVQVTAGVDTELWSLNGNHFSSLQGHFEDGQISVVGTTSEHGYTINVREAMRLSVNGSDQPGGNPAIDGSGVYRTFAVTVPADGELVIEKRVVHYGSNDLRPGGVTGGNPLPTPDQVIGAARDELISVSGTDWNTLEEKHRNAWDLRWANADIELDGDSVAQTILRYNIYHNIIATPAHSDHLPIGARGLSCQAYQGAAFWDQEIFNLPQFLFTEPHIARNILIYRYRTLDGARKKARDLGYRGAFYAWISGDSGEEICPDYFFKDVLSGRPIRNHFNDWQIHVSPDIAYTIQRYVDVTGDRQFLEDYGAEIVFEVARFLFSRVHLSVERNRYEIIRVLGPDEYHENVDNNIFTNAQTRVVAQYAVEVYETLSQDGPSKLAAIVERIGLEESEVENWRDLAARMYVPAPDENSGLIEQFDGFFDHEDVTPKELKKRLLDPGEYWGWPNGIAIATQVSKQADVTQLFMLHPRMYDYETIRANWEYYEPRTQHGSSLSYAVYAITAAWIGHVDEAVAYFTRSCTVDLYSTAKAVSGGTFIGGIHTAACGVAWQVIVSGFAGMYLTENGFGFRPRLPWDRLQFRLQRFGRGLTVEISRRASETAITLTADAGNDGVLSVELADRKIDLGPGDSGKLTA